MFEKIKRYEPAWAPFESPIERELARHLLKYVSEEGNLQNQIDIKTSSGSFRLDFLITVGNRKVAFEANGKDYHKHEPDLLRGALILLNSDIDSIYYLRGTDIINRLPSALNAIAEKDPWIFSEKQILNLRVLNEAEEVCDLTDTLTAFVPGMNEEERDSWITIDYLRKVNIPTYWLELVELAKENPDKKIEEVVKLNREKRME